MPHPGVTLECRFFDELEDPLPPEEQALFEHIKILVEEQRKSRKSLSWHGIGKMAFQRQVDLAQKGWSAISHSDQLPP
jgi:hypothetical protein